MNTFLQALWLVVLFNGNPVTLYPHETGDYIMRPGFYNGDVVWFVPFAASNMKLAWMLDDYPRIKHGKPVNGVEWTPALECALDKVDLLGDIYFINCGQNIILSTEPGQPDYTPLWEVHYLEWIPGLPDLTLTSEAEVLAALALGDLVEITPPSVLDATIVIPTSGIPSIELAELDFSEDEVEFYAFPVFYGTARWFYYGVEYVLITDASDEAVAARLGANWAPNLVNASPDCCGFIGAFVNPTPPGQLPIIDEVPHHPYYGGLNMNQAYNPVLCWTLFSRGSLPNYAVISSRTVLDFLLGLGVISIIPTDPIVTNSPVTPIKCSKY